MADRVFADTAGWASLFVQTEPHYHTARAWFDGWFKPGFVVMARHSITEALTTDHHFEQAGFVRLLKV